MVNISNTWSPGLSGARDRLQLFLFIRLTVLFTALFSVALMHVVSDWSKEATLAAYAILTMSFSFSLVTAVGLSIVPVGPVVETVQILFDAVLTGVWLRSMGTEGGGASLIFIVQILAAAMVFQKRGAWSASLASMISYAFVATGSWASIATYWVLFWVIAATGGYLAEELLRTSERLVLKEETLKRLARLQERILAELPTGLMTVDRNLLVNFINPEAAHMLGKTAEEVVGKLLSEVTPDLIPFFKSVEGEHLEAGDDELQVATHGELSHRRVFARDRSDHKRLQQRVDTGRRVWRGDVASLGAAIEGSGLLQSDVTEGRILLFQDVTMVDRLEERLRQNEKLAAVGQLAAGIAHEIRNPLASMSASIEMLMQKAENHHGEDRRLMEITIREIDRLNGLITEFLEYVKPERMKMERVDLQGLVTGVLDQMQRRKDIPEGTRFTSSVEPKCRVLGNIEKLSQVLLNLLINSIQAVGKNGLIEVGAKVDGDRVCLWVEDNGAGMKESVKAHLFEPFFTTKPKGTGLGLAIAYKIVEAHLGTIEVTSELGRRTRFDIRIPKGNA